MTATDGRTELTVTEAARAAGVDRRMISRKIDDDQFPNAHRSDGKRGPGTGPWLIPVEDLLAAGLTLRPPADGATPSKPPPAVTSGSWRRAR